MFYFYVLKSNKDSNLYKGSTSNLEERVNNHNSGKVFATKFRRPLKLIYSEQFSTREESLLREKYYKTFKGGKELAKILQQLDSRE